MRISDWSSDVCSSDLTDRRVYKLGAIKHHLDFDSGRQCLRHLRDLRRYILSNGTAVLTDQHEHGTDHRLLAVHAARAGAKIDTDLHIGKLPDSDRNTATCRDDGVANLFDREHARVDANEIGLRSEE